jgi:hypothetical protein
MHSESSIENTCYREFLETRIGFNRVFLVDRVYSIVNAPHGANISRGLVYCATQRAGDI